MVIGGENCGSGTGFASTEIWPCRFPNIFRAGGGFAGRVGGGMLNTVLGIGSGCLNVTGLSDPIVSDNVTCTLLEAVVVFDFAFFSFSNAEVRCSRATSEILSLFTFLLRMLMSDNFI